MLLLSSLITSPQDIETLAEILESPEAIAARPVLHVAGLPAWARESGDTGAVDRLRRAVDAAAREIWSGGWSGADGVYLTAEDLEWDLVWGPTNPWDTGLGRLLGRPPESGFPVRTTAAQARAFQRSRTGTLCLGYGCSTLVGPTDGAGTLWFLVDGRWMVLSTDLLVARAGSGGDSSADGGLHLLLPPARADTVPAAREIIARRGTAAGAAAWRDALSAPSAEPDAHLFSSGLESGGAWIDPLRAAACAENRAASGPSRDRTRALLRAASPRPTTEALAAARDLSDEAFGHRELQGGVTGTLRLDTESVGATFAGGRLATLTMGGSPVTPGPRAQGFTQTDRDLRFLETTSAAWFTGLRVRGVHETAHIDGVLDLQTTAFALDSVAGVSLNFRASHPDHAAAHDGLPGLGGLRHAPLELPLRDSAAPAPPLTGAVMAADGTVAEVTILPATRDGDPEEMSVSVAGVAVRVDLPAAAVWIATAHPGALVPLAFTFGRRPAGDGYRDSWFPLGHHTEPPSPGPSRYSVSYRILPGPNPPVSTRVDQDLAVEIDGFTVRV